MRGSSLLPKQFRSAGKADGWLNRNITSSLLKISQIACQHPIHTIVVIAVFASTSYVGLLQESLFDSGIKASQVNGRVDVGALLDGSRVLELSKGTAWKWQIKEDGHIPSHATVSAPYFTSMYILTYSELALRFEYLDFSRFILVRECSSYE